MSRRYLTYNRVSGDDQVQGTSLDWQREQQVSWGSRAGWTHIEDVFDGGQSGAKLDRKGVQRTVELLKDGQVDLVSFYKVDRAARAQRVFEDLWTMIYTLGGKVFVHQKAKVYDTLDDLMADTVWDRAMAEQERYSIMGRTNDGVEMAINAGSFIFRPIFGYYLAKERREGVNVNVPRIDPDRAPTVKAIIDAAVKGEPYGGIAAALNAQGLRTSMRREWSASAVQNVLGHANLYAGQPFTLGRTVRGEKLEATYTYPPIIDQAKYERLSTALKLKPRSRGTETSPLRGVVRCSNCRGPAVSLKVAQRSGIDGFQFYCNTARREIKLKRQKRGITFDVCRHTVGAGIVARKLLQWIEDGGYKSAKMLAVIPLEMMQQARDERLEAVEREDAELERLERRLLMLSDDTPDVFRVFNTQLAKQREKIAQLKHEARDTTQRFYNAALWHSRLPEDNGEALAAAIRAGDRAEMHRLTHAMGLRVKIDFSEPNRTKRRASVRMSLAYDPAGDAEVAGRARAQRDNALPTRMDVN